MFIYTMYDSKCEAYREPRVFKTRGEAVRNVGALSQEEDYEIAKFAADFTLFEIGSWDPVSGVIELYEAKKSLGTVAQIGAAYKGAYLKAVEMSKPSELPADTQLKSVKV